MMREAKAALAREWATNPQGALAPASYLGLSGGSDNGAFGAGLLVGWTERGTRPEFKLVAGISTGALIQIDLRAREHTRLRTACVIRNARLDPEWASVDRRLLSITGRAISTMIHYSGYNDTLPIYLTSQRDGVAYNLAYIGNDLTVPHKQNFDTEYMRALFDYGYAQARRGPVWQKRPPTFAQPDGREALPERRPLRPPIDADQ